MPFDLGELDLLLPAKALGMIFVVTELCLS